ncbi:Cation-transporting ATPase, E1-E2 family [Methanosarcina sp. MTP4]|uniref:cation-translocating P-type ATPase n=1 Tax=Methanosarcina sp. MTP4 TaxID=1434100 RepID=UPI000615472C|nr:cation-translocating P-type ATPase [Methanosarcina sp. MTP4]AKB23987.1 Cation-transporting ATPase, E1-E2 family [Methanosarcina sp. MTP4]
MHYDQEKGSVFEALGSSEAGLSFEEAEKRLLEFGNNELEEEEQISVMKLFLVQFKSILILILIAAALVSAVLGELVDAVVIMFTVFLAGVLGFFQEYRAEKAIELLKSLTAPEALVIRDGHDQKIPSRTLVPGDLILLQAGDRIPADARLVEAFNLRVDEAALTGESLPVLKNTGALPLETPEVDRTNMVYTGTAVTYGRGKALVTATGMSTAFGSLAKLLGTIERSRTPLQESLDRFGRWIGAATLVVVSFVAVLGILSGFPLFDMFLWGVALAVAAIPEALPAVVAVGLGLGVRRMVKRNALVRKLPSVETLGATNVICSDKTGTLTQNKMTVERVYVNGQKLKVTGSGYEPSGEFFGGGGSAPVSGDEPHLRRLLLAGALCNDADLVKNEGSWEIKGDPTEAALVVAAAKVGLRKGELEKKYPRVEEIPFSSESKRMTTLNSTPNSVSNFTSDSVSRSTPYLTSNSVSNSVSTSTSIPNSNEATSISSDSSSGAGESGRLVAYSKGAPEVILDSCTKTFFEGVERPLTPELRQEILDIVGDMGDQALRVIAVAYRGLEEEIPLEEVESEMVFVGLMGMRDPPREEAKAAIRTCASAGIKTVMITGDHKVTASAVARELGIFSEGDLALTGTELDRIEDNEFEDMVEQVLVYARVYPTHKLRVVEAFKKKGYVVAMTGDGVNDAPALKAADMGIAMGITGTDVSKEAASMILTDDNFASIVSAVEEGRNIFKNIKNFITYGLTTHLGEVLIVLAAVLGWQILPLIAVQILWINLITDGLPPMALSVEPPDRGLMRQKPRNVEEGLITRREITAGVGIGVLIAVQALLVLIWALESGFSLEKLQTLIFTLLVLSEMFNAFNWRSDRYSVFALGLFTNKPLIYAIGITLILQLLVIYTPVLQTAFRTVPLSLAEWGVILPLASTTLISMELMKFLRSRRYK